MKKHFKRLLTLVLLLSTLAVKLPQPFIPALGNAGAISVCSGDDDGCDEDDAPVFEKSYKD